MLDNFEDFSELHCGNDEDYPEVDLNSTSGDSDNPDLDEDLDLDRFRKTSSVRGLVPYQTGDVGINLDLDVDEEGWNELYQENDRTFYNTGCCPNNIPAETTQLEHFVDLCLDNEFWGNHSMFIESEENSLGSSGKGARYLLGLRAQRDLPMTPYAPYAIHTYELPVTPYSLYRDSLIILYCCSTVVQ